MTTQAIARRRRPRGLHPRRTDGEPQPRRLPEYLEADEVDAIIRAAEDPRAKLLMLTQWRAGLRVSEALALDVSDLSLDSDLPTLRVRSGKGRKARVVPVHPELAAAFRMALSYGNVGEGRLIEAHRSTAWRWVQAAVERAERLGAIAPGRRVGTHTLRHSYARHLLMHGVPDQLPLALAGALVDTDDAHLPGAGAGSDGKPGGGAVNEETSSTHRRLDLNCSSSERCIAIYCVL